MESAPLWLNQWYWQNLGFNTKVNGLSCHLWVVISNNCTALMLFCTPPPAVEVKPNSARTFWCKSLREKLSGSAEKENFSLMLTTERLIALKKRKMWTQLVSVDSCYLWVIYASLDFNPVVWVLVFLLWWCFNDAVEWVRRLCSRSEKGKPVFGSEFVLVSK